MAKIPYLDKADLAPADHDLLERPLTAYRALAHSPQTLRKWSALVGHFANHSKLNPRLRELALVQIGWLSRSAYEWSHHVKIGLDVGVTDSDIRKMSVESAGTATDLDPAARLVLRAAREMFNQAEVPQSTLDELQQILDKECLVDLVVMMSFYVGIVRLLSTFGIDVEPAYQPYLDRYPLPV
ncbi:MAG: carboxymuconolactone decarboxylase family protein [Burkholderiaceae bacterium]|nr:carboxymuconolactone decarboxylase family protein [Burkholderiaceae bacterium]